MTDVPVIELAGMSEAEKRAYILADNRLALSAGFGGDLGGRDAEACLAEAKAIFAALDLAFDRAQIADLA